MIRIGLYGYGNIARGVECAAAQNDDLTVSAVFTRRDPATVTTQGAPVYHVDDVLAHRDEIDVPVNEQAIIELYSK